MYINIFIAVYILYITCSLLVASSGFLSSRTLKNLGNLILTPFSESILNKNPYKNALIINLALVLLRIYYHSTSSCVNRRKRKVGALNLPDLFGLEPNIRLLQLAVHTIIWLWLVDLHLIQALVQALQVIVLETSAELTNRLILLVVLIVARQ